MSFVALTIAGSDSGGGAGIQADLKTFEAFDVFGTSAITAVTAQNSLGVDGIWPMTAEAVAQQIRSVLSDFKVGAIKTGMLFNAEIIRAVVTALKEFPSRPLVVDPVMVATSGDLLLETEAISLLCSELLPLASVVTPNLDEAVQLCGMPIASKAEMESAAVKITTSFGLSGAVLIKGGHLQDQNEEGKVWDLLYSGGKFHWYEGKRIETSSSHGTGCTFSAAIAASLSRGKSLEASVAESKVFLTNALENGWKGLARGKGSLKHNYKSAKLAE